MLFNSIEFAIFLPSVFLLYWFVFNKSLKIQNLFLLIVSYIFYGWWDWRFLSLIVFSSTVDFIVGSRFDYTTNTFKKKLLLLTSIVTNLGLLGFFKYYNFFVENFVEAFTLLGHKLEPTTLNIILPVGISFYTFQTLSYTIDRYRGLIEHSKDSISFFAFVSFFPQLVAGPIERATNLLPQFYEKRKFDYDNAADGLRQILWGLFKKIVVTDRVAPFVNDIFSNYTDYSGSTLLVGSIFFAFQIYCDFSGYSDIAIGSARLFGFNLMQNFAFPYFSRDIAEFWRRWHISLSTWFRDYLYIPLGGSRGNLISKIRNTVIIFTVSGFWHGANWTFLAWGFLNALYFLPLLLLGKNRTNLDIIAKGKIFPSFNEFSQVIRTFSITLIAWVFFRAPNIETAINYIGKVFSKSLFISPEIFPSKEFLLILFLLLIEWVQRDKQHPLDLSGKKMPTIFRWAVYSVFILIIFYYSGNQQQFIYFQF